MTDSPDERSKVDRTRDPEDPAADVREEYTSYRQEDRPGREGENTSGKDEEEAVREADLQPGSTEGEKDEPRKKGHPGE